MKNGYENTSVQNIIDAVGIAKGTFYHHFVSKDEMLEALLDGIISNALSAADGIDKRSDLNAVEKMTEAIRSAAVIKLEQFNESIVMLRHMQKSGNERLRRYMQSAAVRALAPVYTRFFVQAKEEGLLDIAYPEETSELIAAMGLGISDKLIGYLLAAIDGDDEALESLLRLSRAYERALKKLMGIEDQAFVLYDESQLISVIKDARLMRL